MIEFIFYIFGILAIMSSVRSITHSNPIHALIFLIIFLLAISGIFALFGAYFLSAFEIIIYAGAVMVLFVFVVMTLNLDRVEIEREYQLLKSQVWIYPVFLSVIMFFVIAYPIFEINDQSIDGQQPMSAKTVGIALFGPYILAVELVSILLLAGLIAAFQISYDRNFIGKLDNKLKKARGTK